MFSIQNLLFCCLLTSETLLSHFDLPEIVILNIAFYALCSSNANQCLLVSSFLSSFSDNLLLSYEGLNTTINSFFLLSVSDVLYLSFVISLVVFAQYTAYFLKNKNLGRKNFHFLLFLITLKKYKADIYQSTIYLVSLFCRPKIVMKYFKCLVNNNNKKDSYSVLFLISSLTYPKFFLEEEQYLKLTISICILDSFASICGKYFASEKKTVKGFIAGQVTSWIFELLLLRKVDFGYHFIMGVVEYACPFNDNITISLCSVLYQKYVRRYNVEC